MILPNKISICPKNYNYITTVTISHHRHICCRDGGDRDGGDKSHT